METWDDGQNCMLVEYNLRLCEKFISAARRDDMEKQRDMKYTILFLCGKFQDTVR